MSNASAKPTEELQQEIDLKDPRLAAFLAWLVPGLGHFYQGRTGKAVLFFVCILGTFFYGLYIGGGRVVYASTEPFPSRRFLNERWQYLCQVGVGLPALPALVQRYRVMHNEAPLFGDNFMRPPTPRSQQMGVLRSEDPSEKGSFVEHQDELAQWNYKLGEYFEIGTVFTVIAGLLNILAIFDAYGGPLIVPLPEPKSKPNSRDESNATEKSS